MHRRPLALVGVLGVAAALGAAPGALAEVKINRHGMNMAEPERSYDVVVVNGIRIHRTRPSVAPVGTPALQTPRPSSAAVPMKSLRHPDLVRSAATSIGDRYDGILRKLVRTHLPNIVGASKRHGVPMDVIMAVIAVESGGQDDAVSPKGARGLMQLMPATAVAMGVDDAFDPKQNIDGGTRLLARLLDRYDRDPVRVLAAYNAGEKAVDDHGGIPPYRETRDYIPRVLGAIAAARRAIAFEPSEPD